MKKVLLVMAVSMLCVAAGADVFSVPAWQGTGADLSTDGNPYSDGTNTWTLYAFDNSAATAWNDLSVQSNFANYNKMVWRTGWQFWQAPAGSDSGGMPAFAYSASTSFLNKPELRSIASTASSTSNFVGTLNMTAGETGTYSLDGVMNVTDSSGGAGWLVARIGKFDASNNFTLLKEYSGFNTSGSFDLGDATELQDVAVDAGEQLVFIAQAQASTNSQCNVDLDAVSITSTPIPEPATMALISMGALALIRRRRK